MNQDCSEELNTRGETQGCIGTVVKKLLAIEGGARDTGSIPGSGRSPGVRNGNPLQYSCLENHMDREPVGL